MSTTDTAPRLDVDELTAKVKAMYEAVADEPQGTYHFEMGRDLAERLGYPSDLLDRIPAAAIESFAGVGFFFDMADLQPGERVLDLGSGSGMDVFAAASYVGDAGEVVGIDMTEAQLAKAERLRHAAGFEQVRFEQGRIESLPFADASFDAVISNGVINLSPDKAAVFQEVARVLEPGGRLAIADIVTGQQLSEAIVCNADLWAACIGGATQQDVFHDMIAQAGLSVHVGRRNPYAFISDRALGASANYDLKSLSLVAFKP